MHAAIVETDPDTAEIQVLRYCVVHDCGPLINPMIVEGQVHGGVAQGVGGALYERMAYDESGQLLNASFMDFLMPYASEVPHIEIDHLETPSPLNPLGIKGAGRGRRHPVRRGVRGRDRGRRGLPDAPDADLADRAVRAAAPARRGRDPVAAPSYDRRPRHGRRPMKVNGTATLNAPRDAVWVALNDPAVLVRTIPGCQQLEEVGPDAYRMTLTAGVASIKGTYTGDVALTDQEQPGAFTLRATGAGAPGTVQADVRVTLADAGDGTTRLDYDADAVVGGMIGGVGPAGAHRRREEDGRGVLPGRRRRAHRQGAGRAERSLAPRGGRAPDGGSRCGRLHRPGVRSGRRRVGVPARSRVRRRGGPGRRAGRRVCHPASRLTRLANDHGTVIVGARPR